MKSDNKHQPSAPSRLDELKIEEIARISNASLLPAQFIATDNIEVHTYLGREYLDSLGDFSMGEPFKIRFTMLMFCIGGSMEVQLNLTHHTLRAGEMLMVHEGAVATGVNIDPEIRLFIMGFTQRFADSRPPSRIGGTVFGLLVRNPLLRLGESAMAEIHAVYKIIRARLASPAFGAKDELAWSCLQTICCLLADSLEHDSSDADSSGRRQIIVRDFMRLVEKRATAHRDLAYYATQLCVSPKYLSRIVTDLTGETPRRWICRQVVLEAKALLADPTLTVQQISEALCFANQSFFGTFFRRYAGVSPKDYRRGLSPES